MGWFWNKKKDENPPPNPYDLMVGPYDFESQHRGIPKFNHL